MNELWDGTYTFHDLVTINRILDVEDENRARAADAAAERQRQR